MEPPLLRVQEAAALLRVSKWTIYRWIEEGRLRATKIGRGSLRIFRASLNGLIEGQRTDQGSHEPDGRGKVVRVRSGLRASKRRG
ncbi:MAG: helix-turn-helix domain-containing protein [Nitrospira sp. CG24D]|jgi:excisionase family DNA binding protein|nr:MAG: helix-turn-helix domain-containing protein [Nitrospira sp. CG24D]